MTLRMVARRGALWLRLLALGGLMIQSSAHADACSARSAGQRTGLLELYVSSECTGCQEAERFLARLLSRQPEGSIVPLVFVLDAALPEGADGVLAKRERARRADRRARLGHPTPLRVPLVLLQGEARGDWAAAGFAESLRRAYGDRAQASLEIKIEPRLQDGPPRLAVDIEARLVVPRAVAGRASLYLAAARMAGMGPDVFRYRALEWVGPIPLLPGGRLSTQRLLVLPKGSASGYGAAAFIQEEGSRRVLQSLLRPPCHLPQAQGWPAINAPEGGKPRLARPAYLGYSQAS